LSNLNSIIKLEYFGISPFETEVIYNTLSKFLLVDEGNILVEDSEYASLLNIEFPVAYDEYFFQSFGFDNWQKIKYVLKEMKRRRGRKRFKITLSFCGISTDINSKLVFSLTSEIGPQFEHAIEKIEHIIDTIHIEIKNLESKRQSMSYTYDDIAMKWVLADII
jgi:ubiquinone/menaquinone biosynthesis C-methylase UbiE